MKLIDKYVPMLIAVLVGCAFLGFALTQNAFANNADNDDLGNNFEMEQEAGTSGGTVRRHIDISSGWSGAYLHENMTVEGKAEIKESFSMSNLKAGSGSSRGTGSGTGNSGSGSESATGVAGENNSSGENNPSSNQNNDPNSGETDNYGPDNKTEPEIEPMKIPGWSDLF